MVFVRSFVLVYKKEREWYVFSHSLVVGTKSSVVGQRDIVGQSEGWAASEKERREALAFTLIRSCFCQDPNVETGAERRPAISTNGEAGGTTHRGRGVMASVVGTAAGLLVAW